MSSWGKCRRKIKINYIWDNGRFLFSILYWDYSRLNFMLILYFNKILSRNKMVFLYKYFIFYFIFYKKKHIYAPNFKKKSLQAKMTYFEILNFNSDAFLPSFDTWWSPKGSWKVYCRCCILQSSWLNDFNKMRKRGIKSLEHWSLWQSYRPIMIQHSSIRN